MQNLKVGDKFYHNKKQVTIIAMLENGIVEVLENENGKPRNYKVPISDLKTELEKAEVFFF